MTTENDFLWFGSGTGALVTDQTDWSNETAVTNGFPNAVLEAADLNKALRQGTAGMALLGAFMAAQGQAAVDNGNLSTLLSNFEAALAAVISGSLAVPNVTVFTGSGTFTAPAGCTAIDVEVQAAAADRALGIAATTEPVVEVVATAEDDSPSHPEPHLP